MSHPSSDTSIWPHLVPNPSFLPPLPPTLSSLSLPSRCTFRLRIPITFHHPGPLWCLSSRAIFPGLCWSCGLVCHWSARHPTLSTSLPRTRLSLPLSLPLTPSLVRPSSPSALGPHTHAPFPVPPPSMNALSGDLVEEAGQQEINTGWRRKDE